MAAVALGVPSLCAVVSLARSRGVATYHRSAEIKTCWPFCSARLAKEQDAFAYQERVDLSPGPSFPDELVIDEDLLSYQRHRARAGSISREWGIDFALVHPLAL